MSWGWTASKLQISIYTHGTYTKTYFCSLWHCQNGSPLFSVVKCSSGNVLPTNAFQHMNPVNLHAIIGVERPSVAKALILIGTLGTGTVSQWGEIADLLVIIISCVLVRSSSRTAFHLFSGSQDSWGGTLLKWTVVILWRWRWFPPLPFTHTFFHINWIFAQQGYSSAFCLIHTTAAVVKPSPHDAHACHCVRDAAVLPSCYSSEVQAEQGFW